MTKGFWDEGTPMGVKIIIPLMMIVVLIVIVLWLVTAIEIHNYEGVDGTGYFSEKCYQRCEQYGLEYERGLCYKEDVSPVNDCVCWDDINKIIRRKDCW